mgnify:CR=1 FL=1
MISDEIKENFVQDKNKLIEYKEKISLLELKIKRNIKQIVETEEYNNYKANKTEENLIKLSNLEIVKLTNSLKKKLDIINEQYKSELNKVTMEEYRLIEKRCKCKHLYYKDEQGNETCVKCGYSKGLKNKHTSLRELIASELYIELEDSTSNENTVLPTLINTEPLEYIESIAGEILKAKPDISNEELSKIILKAVASNNVEIIDSIYQDETEMDEETRKIYTVYKKILEINEKNKIK